jgi:hypothetical protein
LDLRSLQVTAPLGPGEGATTIVKRLAKVAGFYGLAAALGAVVVLLIAFLSRSSEPVPSSAPSPGGYSPLLVGLSIIWGVFTIGLIVLLIYRSTLIQTEEEQLYLDDADTHMRDEQAEILSKVSRATVLVRYVGFASGTLLALVLALAYFRNVA